MNTNHLIFDFDGVLGDTFESRNKVLQELEGKSREEVILSGNQYFTKSNHTRAAKLSAETLSDMRAWVKRFAELLQKYDFPLFTAFIQEIAKIKNTKLAIVSSGSIIYIQPKIKESGLTFTHVLSFEDHHSKEEKVEQICKDWGVSVKNIYFFTDTISDVVELENLVDRNKIYGCAWGYQGYEKLATVLDGNHIFKEYTDIRKVFD
jgi:phosphoserine phosphatase